MKKVLVGLTAAGLLSGLVLAAPGSATATSTAAASAPALVVNGPSTLAWHTCKDDYLDSSGAQCTTLKVPLDYRKPNGRKITLAISRVLHTSSAAAYQGVVLVNFGGPGAPGLEASTLGGAVPNGAGSTYDWIGWDPRGVGTSRPALTCKPNYLGYDRPKYVPTTGALLTTWKKRSKSYADACRKKRPALIKHVKTKDSVKDMDRIRAALGAHQISYYGFSYGTYLGAAYASTYPTKTRRMVLDGNVDPRSVWYRANLDQDKAFEKNFNLWFAWLAKYHAVYHLGNTKKAVRKQYFKQLARLDRKAAGGKIGGDEWTDAMLGAGYYQSTWEELGSVFSGWVHRGAWRPIKAEYDSSNTPGDDNGFAMYTATQCTDAKWPRKWSRWQRDNDRVYKKAKVETWANAWFNAPCAYWHVKAGKPTTIRSSVSALLINETLDAATPYAGALELRKRLRNSSLIAEPGGTTHAGSLFGNACVDNQIAAYLATGKKPARRPGRGADASCTPLPRPVPSPGSASLTAGASQPTPRADRSPDATAVRLRQLIQHAALLGRA